MANWTFDPSQYSEKNFDTIPVGDYRARIADVVEKTFKSGNEGYEITLNINGYNSKLWFYLVLDKSNPARTNQSLGDFFNSFGITNYSTGTGKQWIGSVGAVRVKHEQYNGENQASWLPGRILLLVLLLPLLLLLPRWISLLICRSIWANAQGLSD